MTDAWLGFFGGLLTALVGGLIASVVQRHNEKERQREEARLSVYFMLMDLGAHYFWIASADLRDESPPNEAIDACRDISWKIAERLRTCNTVTHLDEILEILFSTRIESANERARLLDELIDKYGKLVNPSYTKTIGAISRSNVIKFGTELRVRNNAPGLMISTAMKSNLSVQGTDSKGCLQFPEPKR